MLPLKPKELKNEAALRVATTPGDHKKLVLIYGAVALGAGIISALLSYITGLMIENTGGLSDLGTRAMLESVGAIFNLVVLLLQPLWMLGLTRSALHLVRQESVEPKNLLDGFPRWGVMLRLCLIYGLTIFAVAYLTLQAAVLVFSMTPFAPGVMEKLAPFMEDPALLEAAMADNTTMIALIKAVLPMLILWLAALLAVLLPMIYGMRLSFYRIIDEDRPGALRAIAQSRIMMRGNKMALFKLDISFWWYYLLQIGLSIVAELPLYLTAEVLPISNGLLTVITSVVQAALCMWLYHKYLLKLETSYALFYDTLYETHKAPPPQHNYWQQ